MHQHVDVIVIGGGAAGSAAALQLGGVRRSVVVVDGGEPRNAPAAHMQGYLGYDGLPPAEFLALAHAELERYGVDVLPDRVAEVDAIGDMFVVTTVGGRRWHARRILVATGLTDLLPDIPGVAEEWGRRVIHCPWCHGWEVRDQRIAVIDTAGFGVHQASIFAQLSDRVTLLSHERTLDDDETARLGLLGIGLDARPVDRVVVDGPGIAVRFADGAKLDADVAVVAPRFRANSAVVEHLVAAEPHPSGTGTYLVVDERGMTGRPGVYAAGNVADPMQQVLHAAAHGSRVATMINVDLLEGDLARLRGTNTAAEWNERYAVHESGMWSGRPNGSLEAELADTPAGRVLDVGCGEGADAVWLAGRGWQVTATDISDVAIDRARRAAADVGVTVDFAAVDGLAEAPTAGAFDLVVMCYPALSMPGGVDAMRGIADAVASGGELLVVGHEIDHQHAQAGGFDPARYLSVDDIVGVITNEFSIEVDETRDRPNPPAGAHHSRDRVLRARRVS
ncbi:MAG: bifunctional NAD(P)/FAD-dependent oxidoreductase/class I SAM-dependent methyltransferase [Acidimicrobiales bacterium]